VKLKDGQTSCATYSASEHEGGRTRDGTRRGGGGLRTTEVKNWDEGLSVQVKGNGDPHCRSLSQNQDYGTLQISQGRST
jgi:hypothetical protein